LYFFNFLIVDYNPVLCTKPRLTSQLTIAIFQISVLWAVFHNTYNQNNTFLSWPEIFFSVRLHKQSQWNNGFKITDWWFAQEFNNGNILFRKCDWWQGAQWRKEKDFKKLRNLTRVIWITQKPGISRSQIKIVFSKF
jgi:hypothetical protein